MSRANSVGPTSGRRLVRVLTAPRLPIGLAFLAMILASPSLGVGWLADDYGHQLAITGREGFLDGLGSRWNPFQFWDGELAHNKALMDLGISPWWTHPNIMAVLWRPLTVVFHHLDYALWPSLPWLMHLHSLAWFGAVVALVAILYRQVEGATWSAGLAALLFSVDDAHSAPAAWIANRSTLLAVVFGVLALLAHHRWRDRASARWGVAGPLLLGLSLLSKEEGLSTTAYLFSYALFIDRAPWRQPVLALSPYVAVVIAWRIGWSLAGAGVRNISIYVDPLAEPVRYAQSVVGWFPVYLLGQFAVPPPEVNVVLSGDGPLPLLWWAGVAIVAGAALVMLPYLRRDRISGFYAVGMVLAVLPICAGFPGDRLLFFAGIGAMGLLGRFFSAVSGAPRQARILEAGTARHVRGRSLVARITAVALCALFLLVHMVLAPILLPIRCAGPLGPPSLFRQFEVRVPARDEDHKKDFVLVNCPGVLFAAYTPIMRAVRHEPVPRSLRVLAPSGSAVRVFRPDANTLVVRPSPSFMAPQMDRLFRAERASFKIGDAVDLPGVQVVVTELDKDRRPSAATYQFTVELDDPSLRWFQWVDGQFVPFSPPAVGETVDLTAPVPKLF